MNLICTFVYILGCISFIIVVGGATYEHLAIVPVWASAVPASLSMFQGDFPIAAQRFWIPAHPISLLLLTASLILNWKSKRRNAILAGLVGYLAVLIITFVYFVPELMAITRSTYSPGVDNVLTQRAGTWESLSLMRLGFLYAMAVIFLFGLSTRTDSENSR